MLLLHIVILQNQAPSGAIVRKVIGEVGADSRTRPEGTGKEKENGQEVLFIQLRLHRGIVVSLERNVSLLDHLITKTTRNR